MYKCFCFPIVASKPVEDVFPRELKVIEFEDGDEYKNPWYHFLKWWIRICSKRELLITMLTCKAFRQFILDNYELKVNFEIRSERNAIGLLKLKRLKITEISYIKPIIINTIGEDQSKEAIGVKVIDRFIDTFSDKAPSDSVLVFLARTISTCKNPNSIEKLCNRFHRMIRKETNRDIVDQSYLEILYALIENDAVINLERVLAKIDFKCTNDIYPMLLFHAFEKNRDIVIIQLFNILNLSSLNSKRLELVMHTISCGLMKANYLTLQNILTRFTVKHDIIEYMDKKNLWIQLAQQNKYLQVKMEILNDDLKSVDEVRNNVLNLLYSK